MLAIDIFVHIATDEQGYRAEVLARELHWQAGMAPVDRCACAVASGDRS